MFAKVKKWYGDKWPFVIRVMKISDVYKDVKWFIQRGSRGYADSDVWDIGYYLCKFLPKMIRSLNKYGCPYEYYDESNKGDECKRWKLVLEEMAQGFEAGMELFDREIYYRFESSEDIKNKEDVLRKKFEKGLELFCKNFFSLWD